jgi:peptide/nickel transport system substrate-binding protein
MIESDRGLEQLAASGVTREQLLKGALGLVATSSLGGLIAACGGSDSASKSTAGTPATSSPRRGGTLTLALSDTAESERLDPATPSVATQYVLVGLVYNALTSIDYQTWDLTPALAESWESSRGLRRWTFKLRSGVTFHDGSPLTAKDVVWSVRRVLDKSVGSSAYERARMTLRPDGLKAVDATTVSIDLIEPDSLLPLLLGRPEFAIVKDGTNDFTVATSIGTGPFKLKSWQAATSWEVERNPDYWESGLPYLDGVRQVSSSEPAALVQGVVAGDFGLAGEVDFASADRYKDDGSLQLLTFPRGISRVLVMDCSVKPFSDERVRTAFKLAMQRDIAIDSVYHGLADPTSDIVVPSGTDFYPPDLGVRPYDPEQAKSLLGQAGYPDGIDVELMTSQVVSGMSDLAVTYSQTAKAAGIRATIKQAAPETYWDKVWLTRPFYTTYWQSNFPPDSLWFMYGPNATYNEAKLKIDEFTDIFGQILRTDDKAAQIDLTQRAQAIAADKWGHIIPGVVRSPWLASTKLHGVQGDPTYHRVKLTKAYLSA